MAITNGSRFRGPAPLHHTLLSGRERTGVTVQTLHPKHFDQGEILAQTPFPGFEHRCTTIPELSKLTANEGASMLIRLIRDGAFPLAQRPQGHLPSKVEQYAVKDAPKISPADRHIDWSTWTAEEILRRHRLIGPLWNNVVTCSAKNPVEAKTTRLIWSSGFSKSSSALTPGLGPGHLFVSSLGTSKQAVHIQTCDSQCLQVDQIKTEGRQSEDPVRGCKQAGIFGGEMLPQIEDLERSETRHALLLNPLV